MLPLSHLGGGLSPPSLSFSPLVPFLFHCHHFPAAFTFLVSLSVSLPLARFLLQAALPLSHCFLFHFMVSLSLSPGSVPRPRPGHCCMHHILCFVELENAGWPGNGAEGRRAIALLILPQSWACLVFRNHRKITPGVRWGGGEKIFLILLKMF